MALFLLGHPSMDVTKAGTSGPPDASGANFADELIELRRDYLADVREKARLMREHGTALSRSRRFKSSFPVLLFLSHQLKGSGGSLGFPEISNLAKKLGEELNAYLEGDSYPRQSPGELAESVARVAEEMERVAQDEAKKLG